MMMMMMMERVMLLASEISPVLCSCWRSGMLRQDDDNVNS
jgi:hypothetical protein